MQPRRYELPKLVAVNDGRAVIDPGYWRADDNTVATVSTVSVRKVGSGSIATWPVVHGTTVVPPNSTPRDRPPQGYYEGNRIVLPALAPADYRLELWRGNVYPDFVEWGHEASDFHPSEAILTFKIPAGAPPPNPPPPEVPPVDVTRAIALAVKARHHLVSAKAPYWQAAERGPSALRRTHPGMCEQAILDLIETLGGADG